jgi:2-amino-4-hydroxy-6-hydroxymethyldihydropteridine diphosphokinase
MPDRPNGVAADGGGRGGGERPSAPGDTAAAQRDDEGAGAVAVVVGLGSNQEPERHLPLAVRMLAKRAEVVATSSAWSTAAVGPPGQPGFVNAAVLLRTTLSAERVKLDLLRAIEAALGRVRTTDRFAPRPIDLDLVLYGDEVRRSAGLWVPDPDLHRHAHVALPASEVAPRWRHPATGETLAAIAARLVASLPAEHQPRRLELPLR